MEEDLKILEENINNGTIYCLCGNTINKAIENLIKGYKELEEYQHKVNQILNLDDDNLNIVLVDNCQKGLKKCVTEFERENQSYRDYFGTPPCYDNANYIPKSKVREKIEELRYKQRENIKNLEYDYEINKVILSLKELLQEGDDK